MSKIDFVGASLLIISLCGCVEMKSDNSQPTPTSERTGSMGVTTQDIDDLGKPASKMPAGSPGGGVVP